MRILQSGRASVPQRPSMLDVTRLRLSRARLTFRRVRELTETSTQEVRLWLCLLAGLVEFYIEAIRSDRIRQVRIGLGCKARTLYLRANGVDVYTFYATFIKGIYDAALPLPRGAVVLDLGANVGITAAYWLITCEDARVIAVEPESRNMALLRLNVAADEASIHQAALAERAGIASLEIRGPTAHKLVDESGPPRSDVQPIRTLTLEELRVIEGLSHVDLMKVDIEGAEARVFSRSWDLLQKCRVVVMEIHESSSREDLVQSFAEQGFRHRLGERIDFPDVFTRHAPAAATDPAADAAVKATP